MKREVSVKVEQWSDNEVVGVLIFSKNCPDGQLKAVLKQLWEEIYDYVEEQSRDFDYEGIGVFINGIHAHIFDRNWVCYLGQGGH